MAHEEDRIEGQSVDPSADLAVLSQMNQAVEVETWLSRSELWWAPLLSLVITGVFAMEAFRDGPWAAAAAGGVIGAGSLLLVAVSAIRRRMVRPAGFRISLRTVTPLAFVFLASWFIVRAWDLIAWPGDVGSRILWLVGGWLATTMVLAVGMAITNRWRQALMEGPR